MQIHITLFRTQLFQNDDDSTYTGLGGKGSGRADKSKGKSELHGWILRGGGGVDMIIKIMRVKAVAQLLGRCDVFRRQFCGSGGGFWRN